MILSTLWLMAMTALWWVLVWFVLPVDLRHFGVPALVSLHLAVPLALAGLFAFIRRWRTRVREAKAAAQATELARQQQERIDAARAEHDAQLAERRINMVCRGAWVQAVTQVEPMNALEGAALVRVDEAEPAAWGDAVAPALYEVFSEAVANQPGQAWLPVYILPNPRQDGVTQIELVREQWRQATTDAGLNGAPADCKFLPGSGLVPERVLALFANDPGMPGCLVLGVDSQRHTLLDEDELQQPDAQTLEQRAWLGLPGQAVALLLLTRTNLLASEAPVEVETDAKDAYTPYWERQRGEESRQLGWGRVPAQFQRDIAAAVPLAVLAAGGVVPQPEAGSNALTRQIQGALEAALINSGLRDLPFDSTEAPAETPFEAGWLVHNCGSISRGGKRLAAFALAQNYFGCELNPIDDADNLVTVFGDTGAARQALALAVGALRVAQTGSPAVVGQFEDQFTVHVLKPEAA